MTEPHHHNLLKKVRQALSRLESACHYRFYDRLEKKGEKYAFEWMLLLTEPLDDVWYRLQDLMAILDAGPTVVPKAFERFVSNCLYGSGLHISGHFTRVAEQFETGQPEPEQPSSRSPSPEQHLNSYLTQEAALDAFPNAMLRDEAIAALDQVLDACYAWRDRFNQDGQAQASDWMSAPIEALLEVKIMLGFITTALDAPPEEVSKAVQELVSYGLRVAGPHLKQLLNRVADQIEAAYPDTSTSET